MEILANFVLEERSYGVGERMRKCLSADSQFHSHVPVSTYLLCSVHTAQHSTAPYGVQY